MKILKTEQDYKNALKKLDELFEASPNTPEGTEFEFYASLIEKYEEEHYPITPPSAAEAIKFRTEQNHL